MDTNLKAVLISWVKTACQFIIFWQLLYRQKRANQEALLNFTNVWQTWTKIIIMIINKLFSFGKTFEITLFSFYFSKIRCSKMLCEVLGWLCPLVYFFILHRASSALNPNYSNCHDSAAASNKSPYLRSFLWRSHKNRDSCQFFPLTDKSYICIYIEYIPYIRTRASKCDIPHKRWLTSVSN